MDLTRLYNLTTPELRDEAERLGVPDTYAMSRGQLIHAIRDRRAGSQPEGLLGKVFGFARWALQAAGETAPEAPSAEQTPHVVPAPTSKAEPAAESEPVLGAAPVSETASVPVPEPGPETASMPVPEPGPETASAPVPEPGPETAAAPVPEPGSEPALGREPEIGAASARVPEPEPIPEPEPVAASEPEPVAASEPEPVAASEPEPVAASELEPVAASELEPVAASEPGPLAAFGPEPAAASESSDGAEIDPTTLSGPPSRPPAGVFSKSNGLFEEPFPTRTMARILADQGYFKRSLAIYAHLLDEEPENTDLQAEADTVRSRSRARRSLAP